MNYYVIEIADGDDKIKGKGSYSYDNERDALASFHKKLGVAMSSDLYVSELVVVFNEEGVQLKREYWQAPKSVELNGEFQESPVEEQEVGE